MELEEGVEGSHVLVLVQATSWLVFTLLADEYCFGKG